MGYEEAHAYLDALGVDAMKSMAPSMHRIEALMEQLDHPQRVAPALHITGTNGKTSVASIATALLGAAGLKVATYTSPHLESIRERLALAGDAITEEDFGDVFDHLRPYAERVERGLGERLTYFEILTGMFFLWAAESPVDAMVVEVGLGGRWDATNVVDAPVAVITNVGLDHVGMLGGDRETIAKEKSGIIKHDAVVVTGERTPGVLSVIEREAQGMLAPVSALDRDFWVLENRIAVGGRYLHLRTGSGDYPDVYLGLHGAHQGVNAGAALEAVSRFIPGRPLSGEVVTQGLAAAGVPGRLEVAQPAGGASPAVVLDVAHNPDAMSALVGSLIEAFPFESVTFVLGILSDKDHRGMLLELARLPARLVLAEPRSIRAVPSRDLRDAATDVGLQAEIAESVRDAVDRALATTTPDGLVCVTGSHYVVGEARGHVQRLGG